MVEIALLQGGSLSPLFVEEFSFFRDEHYPKHTRSCVKDLA